MATKQFTPNETQTTFLNVLKDYADGVTLFELKLAGKEFKSGSINCLIAKGYVVVDGDREFNCDIVYNGVVVGHSTKTGKVYRLVKKD